MLLAATVLVGDRLGVLAAAAGVARDPVPRHPVAATGRRGRGARGGGGRRSAAGPRASSRAAGSRCAPTSPCRSTRARSPARCPTTAGTSATTRPSRSSRSPGPAPAIGCGWPPWTPTTARPSARHAAEGPFARIGATRPAALPGTDRSITVTVDGWAGPWVPTIGDLTSIRFGTDALTDGFRYSGARVSGLMPAGLPAGTSWQQSRRRRPSATAAAAGDHPGRRHVAADRPDPGRACGSRPVKYAAGATAPADQLAAIAAGAGHHRLLQLRPGRTVALAVRTRARTGCWRWSTATAWSATPSSTPH